MCFIHTLAYVDISRTRFLKILSSKCISEADLFTLQNVTGFDKTRLTCTNTEIHFIGLHESHTLALSRHTIDGAIDSQFCFHRRSFANPVKPRWFITESMGPLMGTNKAAWSVKLLLTTVSSYQVVCGSFCALLKT